VQLIGFFVWVTSINSFLSYSSPGLSVYIFVFLFFLFSLIYLGKP